MRPLVALSAALLLPATPACAQVAAPIDASGDAIRAEPVPPQLRLVFERCDINADGQLSWQEFEACWRELRYGNRRTAQPPASIIDAPAPSPRMQPLPGTRPAMPPC